MTPAPDLLVDTDVFVDHLRGVRRLEATGRLHYSSVTRAELFAGPPAGSESVRMLLEALEEVPVDRPVAELAGGIRRETGTALPDALIAASALHRGLSLMTRNRRHFARVEGLRVVDPSELPAPQ